MNRSNDREDKRLMNGRDIIRGDRIRNGIGEGAHHDYPAARGFRGVPLFGHPEDKAMKAATALSRRDDDVTDIKADIRLLKWMVGTQWPMIVALLLHSFWQ